MDLGQLYQDLRCWLLLYSLIIQLGKHSFPCKTIGSQLEHLNASVQESLLQCNIYITTTNMVTH